MKFTPGPIKGIKMQAQKPIPVPTGGKQVSKAHATASKPSIVKGTAEAGDMALPKHHTSKHN